MTEPNGAKARYRTTNWAAYNAALEARGSLMIWLDKDMRWYAPAIGNADASTSSPTLRIQPQSVFINQAAPINGISNINRE